MKDVNYLMKHSSFRRRSQVAHHHLMPDDLWIEGMRALQGTLILISNPPLDDKTPHRQPHPAGLGHTVLRTLVRCSSLCLAKQ